VATVMIVCLYTTTANAQVRIHKGDFKERVFVEDTTDTRNYILNMDGVKLYGNKIVLRKRFFSGPHEEPTKIILDGETYPVTDIDGYRKDGFYYAKLEDGFVKRIVHGEVNVYVQVTVRDITPAGRDWRDTPIPVTTSTTTYYLQWGDSGEMTPIETLENIQGAIGSCPQVAPLVNITRSQLKKALFKNKYYLNDAFEIYNTSCKKAGK